MHIHDMAVCGDWRGPTFLDLPFSLATSVSFLWLHSRGSVPTYFQVSSSLWDAQVSETRRTRPYDSTWPRHVFGLRLPDAIIYLPVLMIALVWHQKSDILHLLQIRPSSQKNLASKGLRVLICLIVSWKAEPTTSCLKDVTFLIKKKSVAFFLPNCHLIINV